MKSKPRWSLEELEQRPRTPSAALGLTRHAACLSARPRTGAWPHAEPDGRRRTRRHGRRASAPRRLERGALRLPVPRLRKRSADAAAAGRRAPRARAGPSTARTRRPSLGCSAMRLCSEYSWPDAAAEARACRPRRLGERAAAVGAGQERGRRLASALDVRDCGSIACAPVGLFPPPAPERCDRSRGPIPRRPACTSTWPPYAIALSGIAGRRPRRDPATMPVPPPPGDRPQPVAAVVQRAGEHDAHHAPVRSFRGAPEEDVDGGPWPFSRGPRERDPAALEEQVDSRAAHVDAPRLDRLAVDGVRDASAVTRARISGSTLGPCSRHVQDDEHDAASRRRGCSQRAGAASRRRPRTPRRRRCRCRLK